MAVALWMLVRPDRVRRFFRTRLFDFLENSVTALGLRVIGLLGIVVGITLIYARVYVV